MISIDTLKGRGEGQLYFIMYEMYVKTSYNLLSWDASESQASLELAGTSE